MFGRYGCNRFCLRFIWSVVFDRYGCNKFCLSLFGVLCFAVTAVIGSV